MLLALNSFVEAVRVSKSFVTAKRTIIRSAGKLCRIKKEKLDLKTLDMFLKNWMKDARLQLQGG